MNTEKPEYIRIRLSLVEALVNEAIKCGIEMELVDLSYLAGKVEAVTELEVALRQEFASKKRDAMQSIQEKINA